MRLLHTTTLDLVEFNGANVPDYAILSHIWEEEEVTLQEMQGVHPTGKKGYDKLKRCCALALANGFKYVWIDTCCIDKTNSVELSEAINSMYRWYQEAQVCYAFLADVPSRAPFSGSRWFTRGWTLQELIAPFTVIFLDEEWKVMGDTISMGQDIEDCSGIPTRIFAGNDDLETYSTAQRMSWAANRMTSRIEDRAYSLLGIFGINMPLIYGERENAFIRLQEEIMKASDDQSLFAWKDDDNRGGILATSPSAFADSGNITRPNNPFRASASSFAVSSRGVQLEVEFLGMARGKLGLAILQCQERQGVDAREAKRVAIWLKDVSLTMAEFERVGSRGFELLDLGKFRVSHYPMRRICVQKGHMTRRRNPNSAKKIFQSHFWSLVTATLLEAAAEGSSDLVWMWLTRSDVRPDLRDRNGQTALALAVGNGNEAIVQMLLARNDVNPEVVNTEGLTLLSWSASLGHDGITELLLKSGKTTVNPVSQDQRMTTPLCKAAENGHEIAARLLLNYDADIGLKDGAGRTPLCLAAENGHEAVIQLLLYYCADTESTNWLGETPLFVAAENGYATVVQLLLDNGAIPSVKNCSAWTPLLKAATTGHEEVIQQLLDQEGDDAGYEAVAKALLDEGIGLEADEDEDKDWRKSPLHWAAEKGRAGMLQLLLERDDVDVNSRKMVDLTPLSFAAKNGHEAVVKLLLNCGAEPDLEDASHYPGTPLLYAIAEGNEAVMRLLLDAGAHTELRNHRGDTPLLLATKKAHTAAVQLLLDKGADVEAKEDGKTPLYFAAEEGYEAIVKLLLDKGAVEIKTSLNETPLSRAAAEGHASVVQMLLQRRVGADLTDKDDGMGILSQAAKNGHEAVVRLLLDKVVKSKAVKNGHDMESVLSYAASSGHEGVVRLLLDKGANPGLSGTEQFYRTPLIPAAESGHESIVKLLLEKGANPNPQIENYYKGPLHSAAEQGHEGIVKLLLEKHADTEAGRYEQTPLYSAVQEGHAGVVRLLLDHGANTEGKDSSNHTPLILAANQKRQIIMQLLLNAGADVEAAGWNGRTALSYAAEREQKECVQMLLEKGADPERMDSEGKTPLQMALRREQWAIVRLMRSHAGTKRWSR